MKVILILLCIISSILMFEGITTDSILRIFVSIGLFLLAIYLVLTDKNLKL